MGDQLLKVCREAELVGLGSGGWEGQAGIAAACPPTPPPPSPSPPDGGEETNSSQLQSSSSDRLRLLRFIGWGMGAEGWGGCGAEDGTRPLPASNLALVTANEVKSAVF